MAIKNFQRHFHLAVKLTILVAVLFPLISGNVCSGNGSVVDTCPEGEYCDEGSCHNCSLCSVNALLQGGGLTKCLCDPTSYKICAIPAPGEQLIEHPKQLSFRNLTGFQNIDFSELKESYNRSSIDCTVPTTPEGPTSAAVTTTSSTSTLPPETPKQPSSNTQSATTKAASPAPENPVNIIAISVLAVVAVVAVAIILGLILWIVCLHKNRSFCCNHGGNNPGVNRQSQGNTPGQGDGENQEQVPMVDRTTTGNATA